MAGTRQLLVGRVLVAIAAAGTTASLIVVYTALRAVLSSGGFCAGGGAYAVAHQCVRSDTVLLLCGTLGMLTFGGLLASVPGGRAAGMISGGPSGPVEELSPT